MSSSSDKQALGLRYQDVSGSQIEALAADTIALVEEFEAAIKRGHVPPAFEKRLIQLRQAAEQLFGP